MASREKRPLAPSKSKQKANNDSGLPSNENRNRKGKILPSLKQQQLAHDILEAVATESQLPAKLEASLPRKKVLKNLKRKQKLRVAKANLIKTKVTKKLPNRNLRRINTDIKRGVRTKKLKLLEEDSIKGSDSSRATENHINELENERGGETAGKSAKNNLRTKKTKSKLELETGDAQEKGTDSAGVKSSPKLSRKAKLTETPESASKSAKLTKLAGFKRSTIRVTEADIKCPKGKKNSREGECTGNTKSTSGIDTKFSKALLDNKSSIDLTIDEVIASMLSDSEVDHQQEKAEGKITRSRKMLVEENIAADVEVKKDPDIEDNRIASDDECPDSNQGTPFQSAIQLRKRSNVGMGQRSLRNGKLRQLSDSGLPTDPDLKKRRRLNSDDPVNAENPAEHASDGNVDTESCFSESSGNESQGNSAKLDSPPVKDEVHKSFDDSSEISAELENNNNSEQVDRIGEVGPILRSKTKARSTDGDVKIEEVKIEDRISFKSVESQDETKKTNSSLDQVRKDSILSKLTDKSKGRRNSLNLDMKKTVHSFYGTEKSDGNPKSQIDQMIENIKLTIAKSIESKIFGPEKGLGLSKNFEVPKIEEIIAPLSAESQKMGLEESADEDKPNPSKNEIKSDSSENSVPKVADTAKEIEKLVMGDIELAETQSQNTQESDSSGLDSNGMNKAHNRSESIRSADEPEESPSNESEQNQDAPSQGSSSESVEKSKDATSDDQAKSPEDKKLSIRKSPRIIDKGSSDGSESDGGKKLNRISKKINAEDAASNESDKSDKSEKTDKSDRSDKSDKSDSLDKSDVSEETPVDPELPAESSSKEELQKVLSNCAEASEKTTTLTEDQEDIIDDLTQVDEFDKNSESEALNASTVSEESETLESISREVEKLVAEGSSGCQAEATCDDVEEQAEPEKSEACATETSKKEDEAVEESTESSETTPKEDEPTAEDSEDSEDKQVPEPSSATSPDAVEPEDKATVSCDSNSDGSKAITHAEPESEKDEESAKDEEEAAKEDDKPDDEKPSSSEESEEPSETKEAEADKETVKEAVETEKEATKEPVKDAEEKTETDTNLETEGEKGTSSEKTEEEQKSAAEENRRVLRARDKLKKLEQRQTSRSRDRAENVTKIKTEDDTSQQAPSDLDTENLTDDKSNPESARPKEDADDSQTSELLEGSELEPQARTRRSREMKKRKEEPPQLQNALKSKRSKRDVRKSDQQKEETLLDNEVAKINENNRSFLGNYNGNGECTENFRGFSEVAQGRLAKIQDASNSLRSKSENDLTISSAPAKSKCEAMLARNLSEHDVPKEDNADMLGADCKTVKTPEISQKDSDEASTSGESSSSVNISTKILETPEDKAKKESILRLLGLESLEKAAERLNHQKARKEQQYTGTLKTVIRVQKEKDKDKKRSRSPLKMVLKQGRGDGEGDSPEFYTIQKEFGTPGLGDSSSGANRKFTTNHRHSCDEDNEESPPKDRQSLVIPEKSSSFSIHPGRLCADVCCYCFGKFGSLDTPMHLAQMKSDERRKKILNIERHLTKDSCLCDACYRHVDRKANTSPTNLQTKPQKQHRQLMVSKCTARDCRDPARHHVKRRWLIKIKAGLQNQVDIDWESNQHTSMSFCVGHYAKIERFLTCALCKRRLARNHTHQLGSAETEELNQRLSSQGIPVLLAAGTFVCKLCRYFTQLQLKYKDVENMNANHRSFFKSYRKRILHYHDIEILENEDEDSSNNQSKDKDKRKKAKCGPATKTTTSKSPDGQTNSASEKSTPEPTKNEGTASEPDNDSRTATKTNTPAGNDVIATDVQFLGIESAVEKLKKRKILDMQHYTTTDNSVTCENASEVVEILAMDKEVTLTRLPKRAKTSNDITPVVQRLGANPSISVRTLFPGEEEMNLHANIEFTNVREITPQGWEKCATMIQYDRDTKLLWQELQRPYGNQSSFLRHLILLEKYYRSGDLVLAPNASRNAINYSTSVQNRLISYEGPEKMDEPIMEPISSEYNNPRRLSGGYVMERDRYSLPSTSTLKTHAASLLQSKGSPPRVLKLNSGVSIIKKPPPSLQRLNLPSTSASSNGVKRKEGQKLPSSSSTTSSTTTSAAGGKVFQLSEPDFKRLQNLKKQKQLLNEKQSVSPSSGSGSSSSPPGFKSSTQYQKAQLAAHTQFQKHLRMQQEMLNRQSRGDFEPLICDIRSMANENSPTQNLLHNLNLPKSIQVTTKPPNQIPILPKIPKSLTVIPQTVTRPATDK